MTDLMSKWGSISVCDTLKYWIDTEFLDVFRNVTLVNAAARRVDATAGELYHLLLKLWRDCTQPDSPVTGILTVNQIKDAVRRSDGSSPSLLEHFDQYLKVLCKLNADNKSRFSNPFKIFFLLFYRWRFILLSI